MFTSRSATMKVQGILQSSLDNLVIYLFSFFFCILGYILYACINNYFNMFFLYCYFQMRRFTTQLMGSRWHITTWADKRADTPSLKTPTKSPKTLETFVFRTMSELDSCFTNSRVESTSSLMWPMWQETPGVDPGF